MPENPLSSVDYNASMMKDRIKAATTLADAISGSRENPKQFVFERITRFEGEYWPEMLSIIKARDNLVEIVGKERRSTLDNGRSATSLLILYAFQYDGLRFEIRANHLSFRTPNHRPNNSTILSIQRV